MKMLKFKNIKKRLHISRPPSVPTIRYRVTAKILFKKNYYEKEKIHLPNFKQGPYISQV